jgi:protein subunit release factor A
MSKIKLALEVVEDLKSLAESIETLVNALENNEEVDTNEIADETSKKKSKVKAKPEEIKEPEEKQPTLEEVRSAMADKSRDGYREAVKAIITKYGANNLSSLDPKHYAAALKEVGEIK